ncbi:MAG: ABC transporter ATP-binding protein [Ignavibacteriaceae bacterium]|nr:ABC transporter ATP-binding protein [Ignavibacteriaceae bacterium]
MFEIKDLTKKYDKNIVLSIPRLEIKKGESFGLAGNNGAGKTTLFCLLLDIIRATSGEVLSKGEDVKKGSGWKQYTSGYLDESFLIDFLTPEEYFYFTGTLYGMNKNDIDEFLVKYHDFFNGEILGRKKFIRDLSKGNQKKAGIVGALIGNPEVIILDEPFPHLDPTSVIRLKKLLKDLAAEGKTLIISSHDLNHVTEICGRIVLLEKGKILKDMKTEEGTLKELEEYFSEIAE